MKGKTRELETKSEVTGYSSGGAVRPKLAMVEKMRLGTRSLEKTVLVTRGPGEKVLAGSGRYLGPGTLNVQRVDFDFTANILSWTNRSIRSSGQ